MPTPKKTKALLKKEIKDLKELQKFVLKSYTDVYSYAYLETKACVSVEDAFDCFMKSTGNSRGRLVRNGTMLEGWTVKQVDLTNEVLAKYRDLFESYEKRIAYIKSQIERRQKALKQ